MMDDRSENQIPDPVLTPPVRRRRAVRSVERPASQRTASASAPIPAPPPVSAKPPEEEAPIPQEAHSVSPADSTEAVSAAAQISDREIACTAEFPAAVPPEELPADDMLTPDDDNSITASFDAILPAAPHPRGSASRIGGILAACAALLLLLGVSWYLYSAGRTEAVMLYIDGAAVGYIEDEAAAGEQLDAVLRALGDADIPFDAALRTETVTVTSPTAPLPEEALYDTLFSAVTEGYVRGMCITADDGSTVACAATEQEILSAIDAAAAVCRETLSAHLPADVTLTTAPRFTYAAGWVPEDALSDEGELVYLMLRSAGIDQTLPPDKDTPQLLEITAAVSKTVSEQIPYETTLVPNDEGFDGVRTMISPGADGLDEVTYTVTLDPFTGEELSTQECARRTVRASISAVSYEGVYPLPDGVSTGSFVWPLSPLPDDELPLDEDGNPYMPQNTLALKNTYISSPYGERLLWGAYDFHLGLDIVAPAYTEIYAADGGVVVYAAFTSSYGYMVRIRHADNIETVYAHQAKLAVAPGDVVEQGQLIGYVGATGTTSGCHLHLEVRVDHITVDPTLYIEIPEEILVLGQ